MPESHERDALIRKLKACQQEFEESKEHPADQQDLDAAFLGLAMVAMILPVVEDCSVQEISDFLTQVAEVSLAKASDMIGENHHVIVTISNLCRETREWCDGAGSK